MWYLQPARSNHRGGNLFGVFFFLLFLLPASEGVCLSIPEGTPVLGYFPGHRSQVLSGGYPSPRLFPRSLVPGPFQRVPQSWPWSGQDGVPPPPGLDDWGTPLTRSVVVPPARTRLGYPQVRSQWGTPPPPPRQNSRANTCTWRAVRLLRSRRRTFLFLLFCFVLFIYFFAWQAFVNFWQRYQHCELCIIHENLETMQTDCQLLQN